MSVLMAYGPPITLDEASGVMAAAENEARRHGWPMVIAIVSSSGHLVMLHALDDAQHGSVTVAQGKAETAVNFRRPSKLFEDAVREGGLGLRLLGMSNLLPLDGGLPLCRDGQVRGLAGLFDTTSLSCRKGIDVLSMPPTGPDRPTLTAPQGPGGQEQHQHQHQHQKQNGARVATGAVPPGCCLSGWGAY